MAHWFHDEAAHVKRRARAVLNAAPKSIAKASGYWRFYDVVLAAFVNVFIVYRWPMVSTAYTGLIVYFCSKESFVVYVSIMTVGRCVLTAGLPLVVGLAFFVFKLLVALCAMIRLVQSIQQLLYGDYSFCEPFRFPKGRASYTKVCTVNIKPSYGWRFYAVPFAALVNAFIVYRWPLVAAAYTGLIACFCSRQSFLVYVSKLTVGSICVVIASFLLFTRLSFFVFKLFVTLCALTRLVQFMISVVFGGRHTP